MLRISVLCTALCALLASTTAGAAPMFVNGGFETGDFTGWTVGGNAVRGVATEGTPITGTLITDNAVDAFTGNFAAFAKFQKTPTPTTLTLEQTLDLEPGVSYSVTIHREVFGTGDYRWTNTLRATVAISGGFQIGPNWSTITVFSYVAPPGQTATTIRFELGGYATDTGGLAGFSIDDITIQQLPEPAGLTVLWVTAVGLLHRRRRRLS